MYDLCTLSTHTFNVYTEVQSELRCQQSSTCILQKYLPVRRVWTVTIENDELLNHRFSLFIFNLMLIWAYHMQQETIQTTLSDQIY